MTDQKVNLGQPTPTPGEAAYSPPTDIVPLPSRGLVYPVGSPLHRAEVVEIRSMTAREEDILTSRALLRQGKAVSALLRSCMTDRSVDVDEMLVGDRNAVLIAIRVTGYGADYNIEIQCPSCEEKSRHTFNLRELPIKQLEAAPVVVGTNVFEFTLPASGRVARFRLLTGADQRDLSTTLDKARKAAGAGAVESSVTLSLLHSLVSVGGETDRTKLSQLVRSMPAGDSRALRNHIESISPGVEMVQPYTCPSCETETEVDVPIGTEFFWPK